MISVENIAISFNGNFLFKKVSFQLKNGAKVGLVGKNGAGKSTLLKLLTGEIEYDEGNLVIPKGYKIGYLRQDLVQQGASIRDSRAIFLAASNGQPETIKLLLRIGGKRLVNEQDEYGNTPLHVAAGMKDPICMKVLLDNGANKELVDRKGRTPWQGLQACKRSDAQFARSMGFDRIQKTAAMAATEAREEEKFAKCKQLLTSS